MNKIKSYLFVTIASLITFGAWCSENKLNQAGQLRNLADILQNDIKNQITFIKKSQYYYLFKSPTKFDIIERGTFWNSRMTATIYHCEFKVHQQSTESFTKALNKLSKHEKARSFIADLRTIAGSSKDEELEEIFVKQSEEFRHKPTLLGWATLATMTTVGVGTFRYLTRVINT